MDKNLHRAWLLMKRGLLEQSKQEIETYISQNPNNPQGYMVLAECLTSMRRHQEAINLLKQAISLAPNNPHAHWLLGEVYMMCARLDLAEASVKKALRLNPNLPHVYASLSQIYHLKTRGFVFPNQQKESYLKSAIKAARSGLEIEPDNRDCLLSLCSNLLETSNRQYHLEAVATAKELLSLDAENAIAYNLYAPALWKTLNRQPNRQDVDLILGALKESIRLNPNQEKTRRLALDLLTSHYGFRHPIFLPLRRYLPLALFTELLLLMLALACIFNLGWNSDRTVICVSIAIVNLLIIIDATYARGRIARHPQERCYLPQISELKGFWIWFGTILSAMAILAVFLLIART